MPSFSSHPHPDGCRPNFEILSVSSWIPLGAATPDLKKLHYRYGGREDHAILRPSNSETWVVYFHSFRGNALEIYTSSIIYPLWIDSIENAGFGLVSFEGFGDSFMAPYAADAIHHALSFIRERYQVRNFIFIGASMGGSGVLIYGVRYPEDVIGALAMCPVTDISLHYAESLSHPAPDYYMKSWPVAKHYGNSLKERRNAFQLNSVQKNARRLTMPLAIAHGTSDAFISVSQSDQLAKLLKDKTDFIYFRYPGEDHLHPSTQGFKDSWPWLLMETGKKAGL